MGKCFSGISYSSIFRFKYSFFFFLYLEIAFWQCFGLFNGYLKDSLFLLFAVMCFFFAFRNGDLLLIPKRCINYLVIIVSLGIVMQLVNRRGVSGITMSAINSILLAFVFYFKKINISILYVHLIIISVVIGYKFYYLGIDPNLMFVGTSRNTISVFLLVATVVINIEELKSSKNLSVLPSLLFVFFSAIAAGRSGLLCSLLFLIVVCWYRMLALDKKRLRVILGYLIGIGTLIWLMYGSIMMDYISEMEVVMRLTGKETSGDQRTLMNMSYLSNINLFTLFQGYDFSSNNIFLNNHLNPHNSFITLHHIYGIVGLAFLFIIIFVMIELWKDRMKIYTMILFTILLRASSDQMMFPGEYDFLVLYFVLLYSYKSPKVIKFRKLKSYNNSFK